MASVLEVVCNHILAGDEDSVSIAQIQKATGVSHGSIYHHFGSRQGLIDLAYAELFSQVLDAAIDEMVATVRSASNPNEFRDELTRALTDPIRPIDGPTSRMLHLRVFAAATTSPVLKERVQEISGRGRERIIDVCRSIKDQGWARPELDPVAVTDGILCMVWGRSMLEVSQGVIPHDAFLHIFLSFVLPMLTLD